MTHAIPAPQAPRTAPLAHRTGPSFLLALVVHALLLAGMSLAVRWKTSVEAPAVAQVWGALPPVMELTAPTPPPAPEPKPEPTPEPKEEPKPKAPDIVEKQEKKPPPKKEEKKKEEKKPPEADKKKEQAQREAERERLRKEEAERLQRQLGAPASAVGPASPGSRGTDAGWNAQIIACIRPHIAYSVPEHTSAEVAAEFRLELLPTGEQQSVHLIRASGLPGFDAAAERAIRRCDPIPRQKDGSVPRSFVLVLRPVQMR